MAEEAVSEAVKNGAEEAVVETQQLMTVLVDKLREWVEGAVALLPNLAVAVLVVVAFALLARVSAALVRRALARASVGKELSNLLIVTVRIGVQVAGLFVALGVLQLDKTVTSLLAGVGVVGLALGFAFQDIAANFMSGTIMAIRTPFGVGDLVETHDTMGTVQRITLRATVIRNFTGQDVIIPNKDVLQNPIKNYTQSGERRVDIDVGVSYDDDLEHARRVAIEAVEPLDQRDADRDVSVVYTGFGGSSIDFTLRFWLAKGADFLDARSNAIIAIKNAFDAAGVSIPFPIRTVEFAPRKDGNAEAEPGKAA